MALHAIAYFHSAPLTWTWLAGLLAMATSAGLLAGFLTPIAGFAAAFGSIGVALSLLPSPPSTMLGASPASWLVATMTATVVLLGPGAYSIDARLFGRREVVIPRPS